MEKYSKSIHKLHSGPRLGLTHATDSENANNNNHNNKAKSQKPHSHKGEVVKSKVVKSLRKFLPLKRKQKHENENRPKPKKRKKKLNWNIFINFFWNLLAKCLNMASICLKKFRCGVVAHEKITDQREAKKLKGKRRRSCQMAREPRGRHWCIIFNFPQLPQTTKRRRRRRRQQFYAPVQCFIGVEEISEREKSWNGEVVSGGGRCLVGCI